MQHREGITLLQVDNDPDFGEITAKYLQREIQHLTVETTTTVDDALEYLSTKSVDCILADYDLPEKDGLDFLNLVRADYPDLPFILFTGEGSEEVAGNAIAANVTDYLPKKGEPVQYTVLANRIVNAVEQYRSKQALADSQRRLSLFFEQSPLGVIEWDTDLEIVRVNPAAEEILGYSEDELVGRSWELFVPDTARDQVADVLAALRDTEGGYHNINTNITKEGNEIVCEWHNRVVTDDGGEVIAIYSQFQDITERQSRTQAITELHELATDFAECATREEVYQLTLDAADRILDFEQAVVATEENGLLHVKAMSEDVPLDERPTMAVDEGIAGKTFQNEEAYLVADAGVAEDAEPQLEEIGGAISVPIGKHGLIQVIDDQPDSFDQHDLELAKLLVQHTEGALTRLERERKLERQNERLDEFASVVSHDLRNPLNVAQLQLTLAQEEYDSEKLDRVEHAHERMESLIEDVLMLARHGETVTEFEPVELEKVVKNCWTTVETGDASLVTELETPVQAAESRLQQLFENLIRNAIDHGGEDVTVTVGQLESGFYIEDDGPGIPEDERTDIFEAGYSNSEAGTGFGLNIVRQIVKAHNWDIHVTDSAAGGTRFEITGVQVSG